MRPLLEGIGHHKTVIVAILGSVIVSGSTLVSDAMDLIGAWVVMMGA